MVTRIAGFFWQNAYNRGIYLVVIGGEVIGGYYRNNYSEQHRRDDVDNSRECGYYRGEVADKAAQHRFEVIIEILPHLGKPFAVINERDKSVYLIDNVLCVFGIGVHLVEHPKRVLIYGAQLYIYPVDYKITEQRQHRRHAQHEKYNHKTARKLNLAQNQIDERVQYHRDDICNDKRQQYVKQIGFHKICRNKTYRNVCDDNEYSFPRFLRQHRKPP